MRCRAASTARPRASAERVEVAGAVARQVDDRGVAAGGGERRRQRLQRPGRAAVAGDQQHGTRPVLRDRVRRRRRRPRDQRPDDDGRGRERQHQEGEDDAAPGGGETCEHSLTVPAVGRRATVLRIPGARRRRAEPGGVPGRLVAVARRSRHGPRAGARLAVPGLRAGAPGGRAAAAGGDRPRGARGRRRGRAVRRPADRGSWRPGVLVGLSGLLDSLDGALAISTGRASRRGFVLDSVVDRLTEAAYAGALWAAGAPGWLAVCFGALCWLPDYLRARAGQAGVAETGALSVWERPTRVILTGLTLTGAGVLGGRGRRRRGGRGRHGGGDGARRGRRRPARLLAAPDAGRLRPPAPARPAPLGRPAPRLLEVLPRALTPPALPPIQHRGSLPCPLPSPAPSPPTI